MEKKTLENRHAVITGGSRGIGYAIAGFLGENGATVIIADINSETGKTAVSQLRKEGKDAYFYETDVSNPDSVQNMMKRVHETVGDIDILVNNAGILDDRGVLDIDPSSWAKVIGINLSGAHYCSQAIVPDMMKNRFGRIVNIASMAGQTGGFKAGVDYVSSKAGVFGLTKSYARYCARYGITVNAVAPGLIETEMTKGWAAADEVPLGYLGSPLDIAKTVFFLVSPLADYMTGQVLSVNGGLFMY
ncbi:MAG: 3-oxoacyl-ACP reductase FabG [Sphaerochaetaceae bacterium]|nr:3-oxoacyl-ACP reductase FabG [Sphaerochaetaceae bacterium]